MMVWLVAYYEYYCKKASLLIVIMMKSEKIPANSRPVAVIIHALNCTSLNTNLCIIMQIKSRGEGHYRIIWLVCACALRLWKRTGLYAPIIVIKINHTHDISMKQISIASSIVCLQEIYSYYISDS